MICLFDVIERKKKEKRKKMQEYISKDVVRCSGQLNGVGVNCHIRFDCLRFLQFREDFKNKEEGRYINPSPFEGLNCPLLKRKENG
jgi:hypothetical protein